MRVFVHQILVEIVSTDPNPASVAMTLQTEISGNEPERKGIVLWTADPSAQPSKMATIPDRPTGTVEQDDAWMNDFVYPLTTRVRTESDDAAFDRGVSEGMAAYAAHLREQRRS